MSGKHANGEEAKPGRRPKVGSDWGPDRTHGSSEVHGPQRRASGDPRTLVAIDNPDDVDLYRHDGPPPGFSQARLAKPPKRTPDNPAREDD